MHKLSAGFPGYKTQKFRSTVLYQKCFFPVSEACYAGFDISYLLIATLKYGFFKVL